MSVNIPVKIIAFFLVFCLNSYAQLAQAQQTRLDPSRVKWTGLHYESYILFFSMNVEAQLKQITRTDSSNSLITPKHGRGTMPQMDPTYRIDVDSTILGRNSLINLWFDPNGNAFQRTQTDTGSKQRVKTYRILTNGYYSRETRPQKNETALPPNKWTKVGEGDKTFNKLPPKDAIIAEPTSLYYLVSASTLNKPGDKFQLYIFTKHGIFQLNLQAIDYQEIDSDYTLHQNGHKQSTQGKFKTLHIRMNATPLDPAEGGNFDFLGLKGDIHLYMEPQSRVLLQISGEADIIGHTDIKLKEVAF